MSPNKAQQVETERNQNGSTSTAFKPVAPDISQSIPKTVLGIILGGGAGSRLFPLTKFRAKPAVPLGAGYRLIDIPEMNMGSYINPGFVEVLAAQQSPSNKDWFQGTADAVRQYSWLFREQIDEGIEDFLILAGDHLYRMNYQHFIQKHREANADITVSALPCVEQQAQAFGLMKIDETGRIIEFSEKPKGEALQKMKVDTTVLGLDKQRAQEMPYIASMGIYVAKAGVLSDLLDTQMPQSNDFGSEIIPGAQQKGYKVQAYLYDGYWEDIGTVAAFYKANLALVEQDKQQQQFSNGRTRLDPELAHKSFSFYDKEFPIYTMSRFLPPSKVAGADITNCVLGDGCQINPGTTIRNSMIGLRSVVSEDCTIEDTLLMGCDYYEKPIECELLPGCLPIGIGDGCTIKKAIIDKNARIGPGSQLVNDQNIQESYDWDSSGVVIKDGIIIVLKDGIVPSGFNFNDAKFKNK